MLVLVLVLVLVLALALPAATLGCSSCDESPRSSAAASADASAAPPPPAPRRDGCARTGPLELLESDPACVVRNASDEAMRTVMKSLAITTAIEPPDVFTGGSGSVTVTIRNTSSAEAILLFEARPRPLGPRPDWARVAGIPEQRDPSLGSDAPRLFFPLTTTDAYDRDVDAVPTIPGSGAGTPAAPTILAVRLRPGGKLTHSRSWWALRIPAPAAPIQDEAGHRYVPKTSAIPLVPGEYGIVIELPLYGLTREERKTSTRVKVTRAPIFDGG